MKQRIERQTKPQLSDKKDGLEQKRLAQLSFNEYLPVQ